MDIIAAHDLRKQYAGRTVVAGIDLTVRSGECLALLGPNGAGKTTTVEMLAGFRRRSGGRVSVLGVDPDVGDRAWRSRIGVVGQQTGAALELSVVEAVRHFACYHARPRPTGDLLAAVGLTGQAHVRIGRLSGGQRRRLDVALGVQGRPDLLFLDEPTTGLDPQARRQFWTLVEDLKAGGTTIVLTTHYIDEAARLADRVAVIAGGRLVDLAVPPRIGAQLGLGTCVSWTDDGTRRETTTSAPTQVLRELLARDTAAEIPDLAVRPPTLEDAYLALLASSDAAPERAA